MADGTRRGWYSLVKFALGVLVGVTASALGFYLLLLWILRGTWWK